MKCPVCEKKMIKKAEEDYKTFWICSNEDCYIITMILTTTKKVIKLANRSIIIQSNDVTDDVVRGLDENE